MFGQIVREKQVETKPSGNVYSIFCNGTFTALMDHKLTDNNG